MEIKSNHSEDKLTFKVAAFEGPLDLLLHLIRKNKMNIYDIQMTAITSQYIDYLHQMQDLQLDVAGEYLVMAATLLNIKSKMLLPRKNNDSDVEEEEDPREDLLQQLLLHKYYQELGGKLADAAQERNLNFTRDQAMVPSDAQLGKLKDDTATPNQLQRTFERVLARKKFIKFSQPAVKPDKYSVKTETKRIKSLLKNTACISFNHLFDNAEDLEQMVTLFLALLELVKDGDVKTEQQENLQEILILRREKAGNAIK